MTPDNNKFNRDISLELQGYWLSMLHANHLQDILMIRICGDNKVTINLALHINQYLMPTPEDLMATLVGEMKLNLLKAYQQVQLHGESRR